MTPLSGRFLPRIRTFGPRPRVGRKRVRLPEVLPARAVPLRGEGPESGGAGDPGIAGRLRRRPKRTRRARRAHLRERRARLRRDESRPGAAEAARRRGARHPGARCRRSLGRRSRRDRAPMGARRGSALAHGHPLDGPLLEDDLAAFRDLSSSIGWKPVALAAVAATIAGPVFLSSGSSESPGPEPPPMVAMKREASAPELGLATAGQSYLDPQGLERLPKEALALAIAAAEAQPSTSGRVQDDGARAETAVRPTTPMRNTTQDGPKTARQDEKGPTVQDEATAKIDPTLTWTVSSTEESPGIDTASTPLAKRPPSTRRTARPPQPQCPPRRARRKKKIVSYRHIDASPPSPVARAVARRPTRNPVRRLASNPPPA